jgi:hypothetical protein
MTIMIIASMAPLALIEEEREGAGGHYTFRSVSSNTTISLRCLREAHTYNSPKLTRFQSLFGLWIPNFQTILLNTLWMFLFKMSVSKAFITTGITAILIAITIATTAATFPNIAVFATFFAPPEQVGNDTSTEATTTTPQPPTAGGGAAQQQQQSTIHITKDGTNSYVLSGGSSSIGSFDTTYRVVGERSAIRASEDLIISTITSDFSSSPTIGYIMVGNTTSTSGAEATLPNPFASPEMITERITNEFRRVISEAENNTSQGQELEIKCGFGMTLEDMQCHYIPLLQAGQG